LPRPGKVISPADFQPRKNRGNLLFGIVFALWHIFTVTTVFHTTADELDESFVASVKAAFKGRSIEITVVEDDETGYLLRHQANRDRLLRAVSDIEAGQNLITPDQERFR